MQNPNIIKSFEIDAETLIKSNYTDSEEIINTLESNLEKGLISEIDFFKSLETVKALDPENERVSDLLEKGGEGSRGGKVIGHTKSGKPIYASSSNSAHKDFTEQDHRDSRSLHTKLSKEVSDSDHSKGVVHRSNAAAHDAVATAWKFRKHGDTGVIGKTKSGKDIYGDALHEKHADFTEEDLRDAAKINRKLGKNDDKDTPEEYYKKVWHRGQDAALSALASAYKYKDK